ncbi:MAG: molybdopterin-dependent oxidoreductase [Gemmataceae bacterium]
MKLMKHGGGWAAIRYTLRMARKVGWWRLFQAMRSRNACKTCALGMGGQAGGMRNEQGHWPEVCKKSLQAMVADMQQGLRPEFFQRYSIAQLQTLSPRELEWCGRLTMPLRAGPGDSHYRPIGWDEALARVADQLRRTRPDENFFYASGRSSNEAGFLLQLFARLYGTNFVNNCSYYCHQASGVGLGAALGTSTATVSLEDIEKADLFLLIGGNPASNHPRLMRTLMNIRRRGGHVIVINPVKEVGLVNFAVPSDLWSLLFGSKIASLYVQPHIGGDLALLTGVASSCSAPPTQRSSPRPRTASTPSSARKCMPPLGTRSSCSVGVEPPRYRQGRGPHCSAKNAAPGWTSGITHHEHGVANVRAIVNPASWRHGRPSPRRSVTDPRPFQCPGDGLRRRRPNWKQQVLDNLESYLHVKLPRSPGLDTMACMQASERGELRSAFCLGGNLFGSNPDAKFAQHRALGRLDLVTYLSTTLNTATPGPRPRDADPARARHAMRNRKRPRKNQGSTSSA